MLVIGLVGCADWSRTLQYRVEPSAPLNWQEGGAATVAAPVSSPERPWWRELHDPQLELLQAQAARNNIDSLRKALSWRNALLQARLTELNEQPHPSLSMSANTNWALHSGPASVSVNGISVPVSSPSTSYSFASSFELSYEVDLWSRLSQITQVDRAKAEIAHEDVRSARWLVSTKVAEAYWAIGAIDAKLPMVVELVQAADETVRIAHIQMKEGKLRADEVDAIVTKQYEARKRLADVHADRRKKLHELGVLLDREQLLLAPGEARLPAGEPVEPALGSPAQMLERRPDVRQARLAVDAALANLHVAQASRYPALSLSLALRTNGETIRDLFSQPIATLGQSLLVPLVDWRRLDAQRDEAKNALDDAALALRASVRQALVDVEDALVERERWRHAWLAARMQQTEKEKVYAVAQLRQEVGVFGRLDVLQSREGVLKAQIDIVDLRLKAWINLLNLYKALGGAV